jgi:hypothetical protein
MIVSDFTIGLRVGSSRKFQRGLPAEEAGRLRSSRGVPASCKSVAATHTHTHTHAEALHTYTHACTHARTQAHTHTRTKAARICLLQVDQRDCRPVPVHAAIQSLDGCKFKNPLCVCVCVCGRCALMCAHLSALLQHCLIEFALARPLTLYRWNKMSTLFHKSTCARVSVPACVCSRLLNSADQQRVVLDVDTQIVVGGVRLEWDHDAWGE